MDYPPPEKYRTEPPVLKSGKYLIQPVALEPYSEGFEPTVVDFYRRDFCGDPDLPERRYDDDSWRWRFTRRVRQYNRPLHYGLDGKNFRCETCEKYWEKFPDGKPDEVLLTWADIDC